MTQPELFDVGPRTKMQARPLTPARVGSGPEGERCGTCRHCQAVGGVAGRYLKCFHHDVEGQHTRGPATDIKARWPACRCWRPKAAIPAHIHEANMTIDSPEAALVAADWLEEHGADVPAKLLRALTKTDYTFPMEEAPGSPDGNVQVEIPNQT